MKGTIHALEGGALLYAPPTEARQLVVLCCADDSVALTARAEALEKSLTGGPALLSPHVDDWDADFTPWPAEALPGRAFTGGGAALDEQIRARLLPGALAALPGVGKIGIAGYSLGGLFALWAACRPGAPYAAAACMSGSLWYPGVAEWLDGADAAGLKDVYISLGLREAKRARGIMAGNGPAAEAAYARFRERLGEDHAALEWNNGDHFFEVDQRINKGIAWITRHMA